MQFLAKVIVASKFFFDLANHHDLVRVPAQYKYYSHCCKPEPPTNCSSPNRLLASLVDPPIGVLDEVIEYSLQERILTIWLRVAQAHQDRAIRLFVRPEVSRPPESFRIDMPRFLHHFGLRGCRREFGCLSWKQTLVNGRDR
jgi:hypothetical protein